MSSLKFKVGQVVVGSDEVSAINRVTYIVDAISPGEARPYFVSQITGERIRLSRRRDGSPNWHRAHGAWALESQLRALPDEEVVDTAVVTMEAQSWAR